ncbi:Retrotransposon-derived protein PEG10 [Smittium culicis]|uniref:Retrotransposon-derived protein PEG10 n=1 Tax=Smittium culicis TaxID=133412 RepID=A0A1R1YNF9_9FUNG|nr:Retrotransposon-derived protein PEG10 [Smittium culicis]
MSPRHRPFYPETYRVPNPETNSEMDQIPNQTLETVITPEQEYIDNRIRIQVQTQVQAQVQDQVQAEMQAYLQNHAIAQAQLQQLSASVETPDNKKLSLSSQSSLTNRIKLPDAAKFDGNFAEYSAFTANMNLFFWGSSETFVLDRNKILFVGIHILGTASTWFGTLVATNSYCPENYEAFIQEFRNNFSDSSHSIKARGLIRNCKQGARSASAYATEFRALARESGFDRFWGVPMGLL